MKTSILIGLKSGAAPLVMGVALIAAPAFAQTAPAAPAATDNASSEIIVTGSLIRNPNISSVSPVSVIGKEEIQLRQVTQAEDILRTLPGAVPNIGSNVNNGNNGASYVDLRGLGSARNIVLLDGTRLTPSGTKGRVDLNNIPVALIERVDALTGGASTTYGADAVSGVVNFITKKNFAGVDLDIGSGITEEGDGKKYHATLTIGGNFDDGKGNAVLSVGYDHADPVYQTRPYSLYGISSTSGKATGASATSTPTAVAFDSGDFLQVSPDGSSLVPQYVGFNFNPYNLFQVPFKRYNIYAAAHYEISDAIDVYTRGIFSRNTVSTIVAPSGIFGAGFTIPGQNPYLNASIRNTLCTEAGIALGATCDNNAAIPLPAVYRRAVEVGPRIDEYTTDYFDYKAGFRGNITSKFNYDVYGSYGESTNTQSRLNYVSTSRVQNALNATNTTTCSGGQTGCVPLNLLGPIGSITPAMASYIGGLNSTIAFRATLVQVHGIVSGELTQLPWASSPVTIAAGVEYRKYSAKTSPDNLAQVPGELGGAGGAILPLEGGYDVREAFGELNIPVVSDKPFFEELTMQAGIRQSWYHIKTTGSPKFSATTWKLGLAWTPVSALKVRGNYQRAVRAPNIDDLFLPVTTGLTNLTIDPCAGAAPTTNANLAAICRAQGASAAAVAAGTIQNPSAGQANEFGGGNPNLKPEVADTYTIGIVLQPKALVPNLTFTLDYYNIKINNAITTATPDDAIAACFGNITAASASSPACTLIRRNPASGRLSGDPATTQGLFLPLTNAGRLATDGFDFSAAWRHEFGKVRLGLNLDGNYTRHSYFRASLAGLNRDCVGYYSANCASIQPKWSWLQRTTVGYKGIDVSLLWRHISAVQYEPILKPLFIGTIVNGNGGKSIYAGKSVNFNKIPSYNYFDMTARFKIGDHLELTTTVANMFDKDPPLVGGQAGATSYNAGNTYPSTYDSLGRRYSVGVRIKY